MADALASGASDRKVVGVQVPPRAPPQFESWEAVVHIREFQDLSTQQVQIRREFCLRDQVGQHLLWATEPSNVGVLTERLIQVDENCSPGWWTRNANARGDRIQAKADG